MKHTKMIVEKGDITRYAVDAIVNAANSSLLGGGGVDGAIHRAAGPQLLAECRTLGGCETGQAKITKGYNLPAKYVIHTVGPIWHGGDRKEAQLLRDCYLNCLRLAEAHHIRSIAFPAISTGVYRFPVSQAANIAVDTVMTYLAGKNEIECVYLICFDEATQRCYQTLYEEKISNA